MSDATADRDAGLDAHECGRYREIVVHGSLLLLEEDAAAPSGYRRLATLVVDGAATVLWEQP